MKTTKMGLRVGALALALLLLLWLWIGYSETDRWDQWINGLSHVIRLEDGSFIIIDGGHQREMNDRLLYETLKKQAPDPNNIRVAAWIFTHGHGDHKIKLDAVEAVDCLVHHPDL